jgi:L-gulonolactone oxidase
MDGIDEIEARAATIKTDAVDWSESLHVQPANGVCLDYTIKMSFASIQLRYREWSVPMSWHNWSGHIRCNPSSQIDIASESDVLAAIATAARTRTTIRQRGTGHSCSPLCATDDVLMSFHGLKGITQIDPVAKSARIGPGTPISDMGEPLCKAGLALENQGDIDLQTLAGAIATGTHGTGLRLGNISSKIVGLRLALASGDVVSLSPASEPRLFDAAVVSLGALGVILDVTIALVKRYRLHERNRALAVEDCLAQFPKLQEEHRNVEFFWLPVFDKCIVKALDETQAPPTPEDLMDPPMGTPGTLERYLRPERVHWSHRIYPSRRAALFNEMEFAVPLERGLDCFTEIRAMMQSEFPSVTWAVEYRPLAADNAYLSQAHGRPSACISVHEEASRDCLAFFSAAQEIFLSYGGRPHWGKTHFCTARQLESLYPRWSDFVDVRNELDPRGIFLNEHLREIFGVAV